MIKMSWSNKLVIIATVVMVLPLTGQHIVDALDWALQQMSLYSAFIVTVCALFIACTIAYSSYVSGKVQNKVKIPRKGVSDGKIPFIEKI